MAGPQTQAAGPTAGLDEASAVKGMVGTRGRGASGAGTGSAAAGLTGDSCPRPRSAQSRAGGGDRGPLPPARPMNPHGGQRRPPRRSERPTRAEETRPHLSLGQRNPHRLEELLHEGHEGAKHGGAPGASGLLDGAPRGLLRGGAPSRRSTSPCRVAGVQTAGTGSEHPSGRRAPGWRWRWQWVAPGGGPGTGGVPTWLPPPSHITNSDSTSSCGNRSVSCSCVHTPGLPVAPRPVALPPALGDGSPGAGKEASAPPSKPTPRLGRYLRGRLQLSVPVMDELHDGVHRPGRVEVICQGRLHGPLGAAQPVGRPQSGLAPGTRPCAGQSPGGAPPGGFPPSRRSQALAAHAWRPAPHRGPPPGLGSGPAHRASGPRSQNCARVSRAGPWPGTVEAKPPTPPPEGEIRLCGLRSARVTWQHCPRWKSPRLSLPGGWQSLAAPCPTGSSSLSPQGPSLLRLCSPYRVVLPGLLTPPWGHAELQMLPVTVTGAPTFPCQLPSPAPASTTSTSHLRWCPPVPQHVLPHGATSQLSPHVGPSVLHEGGHGVEQAPGLEDGAVTVVNGCGEGAPVTRAVADPPQWGACGGARTDVGQWLCPGGPGLDTSSSWDSKQRYLLHFLEAKEPVGRCRPGRVPPRLSRGCGPTLPTYDHITPPLPRYMRSPIVPKGHLLLRSWTLGACGHDWSSQQGGARTPESPSGAGRGCALCPQDTAPGAAGHMHWGPPPLCSQVTKQGVGSDCRRGFAGTRPPQNRRAPPTRPQGLT